MIEKIKANFLTSSLDLFFNIKDKGYDKAGINPRNKNKNNVSVNVVIFNKNNATAIIVTTIGGTEIALIVFANLFFILIPTFYRLIIKKFDKRLNLLFKNIK